MKASDIGVDKQELLILMDTALTESKVSSSVKKTLLSRVEHGLEDYEGEKVSSDFAYDLIYSFRYLIQYGLEYYGQRPGRKFETVDIETFVCSSQYMDQKAYVREPIMDSLRELFDPNSYFYEVVEGGAIGIGKNYFANMAMSYIVYDLSSYYSPQVEFGLAPGSDIIFMHQSASVRLARRVVFGQFKGHLALSPYFRDHYPWDSRVKTELRFPNDILILPISSTDTAALGMNIYGGIIDEMSYMQKVKSSTKVAEAHQIYDQAEKLYNTVIRRMESRFLLLGKLPGKLFLLGAANYPGDFIDKKIEEAEAIKRAGRKSPIFVLRMTHWESYPKSRFTKGTFKIALPSEISAGRVIPEGEKALDGEDIREVPIDYKERFERDFEGSLRDIVGIPVGKQTKFIRAVAKITSCMHKHEQIYLGRQLFLEDTIDQRRYRDIRDVIDKDYVAEYLDTHTVMGVHIDLAKSEDLCGLAIGRVMGFTTIKRDKMLTRKGEESEETLPLFAIDGVTAFVPPPNGEIDFDMVRDLVLALKDMLNVVFANLDSWQSVAIMQAFRKRRISSQIVSVDRNVRPYKDLKDAIVSGRVIMPRSAGLLTELRELIYDPVVDKVDHLSQHGKDRADCVCGVLSYFAHRRSSYRTGNQGRPVVTERPSVQLRPKDPVRKIHIGSVI